MQTNVLRYLPSNENAVTILLRALCALKPIREAIVRLFTHDNFGAAEVEFEAISTHTSIEGPIPDMRFQTEALCVVVEIKVSASLGLTANQPQQYLQWLVRQPVTHKFFVFLVPPHYAPEHRREYESRKAAFCTANPHHGIQFVEIHWLEVRDIFDKTGLSATSGYARDFHNLLEEWYVPTPLAFTRAELGVTTMFNTAAATALHKLFQCVDDLASEFERAGFTIAKSFPKRWWESEHGLYIRCGNAGVLFLGIWSGFWRKHGSPLCIGVHKGMWAPAVIARFQQMFPSCVTYPPTDPNPYLVTGIEQYLLMQNAVRDVSTWLLQGYLNGICDLVPGNPPAPSTEPLDETI